MSQQVTVGSTSDANDQASPIAPVHALAGLTAMRNVETFLRHASHDSEVVQALKNGLGLRAASDIAKDQGQTELSASLFVLARFDAEDQRRRDQILAPVLREMDRRHPHSEALRALAKGEGYLVAAERARAEGLADHATTFLETGQALEAYLYADRLKTGSFDVGPREQSSDKSTASSPDKNSDSVSSTSPAVSAAPDGRSADVIGANYSELIYIARDALPEDKAREIVRQDSEAMQQIQDPNIRFFKLEEIGENASLQINYRRELKKQAPELATEAEAAHAESMQFSLARWSNLKEPVNAATDAIFARHRKLFEENPDVPTASDGTARRMALHDQLDLQVIMDAGVDTHIGEVISLNMRHPAYLSMFKHADADAAKWVEDHSPQSVGLEKILLAATRIAPPIGVVPDPVAQDLLASSALKKIDQELARLGLKNLSPLGAGASSIVLDAGDKVVRLGLGELVERPTSPNILQPEAMGTIEGVRFEVLPKVDIANISEDEVQALKAELRVQGIEWGDDAPDNMGRYEGRLVVTDPGGVKVVGAPQQQQPPRAEVELETPVDVSKNGFAASGPRPVDDFDPAAAISKIMESMRWEAQKDGSALYYVNDLPAFVDHGQQFVMTSEGENDEQAILAAILLAREKFGGTFEFTGTPEFKQKAMEIMIKYQIDIRLKSPEQAAQVRDLKQPKAEAAPPQPTARDADQQRQFEAEVLAALQQDPKAFKVELKQADLQRLTDVGQVLNDMLPLNTENPFWQRHGLPSDIALLDKHVPGLATLAEEWSHDRTHPTQAAPATETAASQPAEPPVEVDRLAGDIVELGAAPYQHDKENSQSFFVTLQNADGKLNTVWGVDLRRVAEEAELKAGDQVTLRNLGQQPVEVSVPIRDDAGKIIRHEMQEVMRNTWSAVEHTSPQAANGMRLVDSAGSGGGLSPVNSLDWWSRQCEAVIALATSADQLRRDLAQLGNPPGAQDVTWFDASGQICLPPDSVPPALANATLDPTTVDSLRERAAARLRELPPTPSQSPSKERQMANSAADKIPALVLRGEVKQDDGFKHSVLLFKGSDDYLQGFIQVGDQRQQVMVRMVERKPDETTGEVKPPFLAVYAPQGHGDNMGWTQIGHGNAVNQRSDNKPVYFDEVLFKIDGQLIKARVNKAVAPELHRCLGFQSPREDRPPRNTTPGQSALQASVDAPAAKQRQGARRPASARL